MLNDPRYLPLRDVTNDGPWRRFAWVALFVAIGIGAAFVSDAWWSRIIDDRCRAIVREEMR